MRHGDMEYLASVAWVQRTCTGMIVGRGWRRAARLVEGGFLAHCWLDDENDKCKSSVVLTRKGVTALLADEQIEPDEAADLLAEASTPGPLTDADLDRLDQEADECRAEVTAGTTTLDTYPEDETP